VELDRICGGIRQNPLPGFSFQGLCNLAPDAWVAGGWSRSAVQLKGNPEISRRLVPAMSDEDSLGPNLINSDVSAG